MLLHGAFRWVGEANSSTTSAKITAAPVASETATSVLLYQCEQGDCATTDPVKNSTTVAPTENTGFTVVSAITTASGKTTNVTLRNIASTAPLVTKATNAVTADDIAASLDNGQDSSDADFMIYVLGARQSSIPLTGGTGTGRWFLFAGGVMAIIAAAAVMIRKFSLDHAKE
jgi:hypothetical protein